MRYRCLNTILFAGLAALPGRTHAQAPDFTREVRPIITTHCFKCHGPDDKQRKAGLRLDIPNPAVKLTLLKGHPMPLEKNVFVQRIGSHGDDIMPPAVANKPLIPKEIDILKRWVASGAVYKTHWAFVPPVQAPPPSVKRKSWPKNAIDAFLLADMEKAGLNPSAEADRSTLVRRVYLDLVGLPPTPEQADAFLKDRHPDAYERLVDQLLASPHYGERWARRWLDLARYADTNGYEKDRQRSIWPYRDWVIKAFNADMPFDQFTIAQIAGDMLPNPTPSQIVATGFHRNTMLNEEGGIDPLEFRFYSMTDRMAVTGTIWMGLTVQCAQCHTHKYDPITTKDYYSVMACMDNTEEITMEVPDPALVAKRKAIFAQADLREKTIAERFPIAEPVAWNVLKAGTTVTASGARAVNQPDESVLITGVVPDKDTYTITIPVSGKIDAIKLETLTDPSLGSNGPGRTPHGNFVLTHFTAAVDGPSGRPLTFTHASADVEQDAFSAGGALLGKSTTGWAVDVQGKMNANHQITFYQDHTLELPAGSSLSIKLDMQFGGQHTIGRFRLSAGAIAGGSDSSADKRKQKLDASLAAWIKSSSAKAVHWITPVPSKLVSNLPKLALEKDGSVYVSGDQTKLDTYNIEIPGSNSSPVTAIRIEALPDDRLPGHGPGRVFYEGSPGDFFLSEMTVTADGKPVTFSSAIQNGGNAGQAIDGNKQTGWSINGRQGLVTSAVFILKNPVRASKIALHMEFEQYYTAPLGRFRISYTTDARQPTADLPDAIEKIMLVPNENRTAAQNSALLEQFLQVSPELQGERDAIAQLRSQAPALPTTLVFRERAADNPRQTFIHHRGEFLNVEDKVRPATFTFLKSAPANTRMNRLAFARWLVSGNNPLVARVTVNRQWAAFFGRGIVRTTEDFGFTGESPSNQALLDWLAVKFVTDGWSLKKVQRLIVTSAAYRQSSTVTPSLLAKDPENKLLAHAPRVRLEAEQVRDSALTASGLLSEKIGGPSVFPPQPAGVTSEGAYGALTWNVSTGEDRYRRGLYTFSKRTTPYAMFQTFDAPSGETCVARREISDTPLQALTLLNDQVFMETSQAAGKLVAAHPGSDAEKAAYLFRRVLTRVPTAKECAAITAFEQAQEKRFRSGDLNAALVSGAAKMDPAEGLPARAAWTSTARALLNLDEFITKQ